MGKRITKGPGFLPLIPFANTFVEASCALLPARRVITASCVKLTRL